MYPAGLPEACCPACTPRRLRGVAWAGRQRVAGVSLLEMLLVVGLIAVIGLLAAMSLGGGMDGMQLRSAGKEIAAQLRYARTQAIASGQPQQFNIDPQARVWEGANGRRGNIPAALRVQFTGAREASPRAGTGAIRFFEDGASTGGRIDLQVREARWRIDVAWITGEVRSGAPAALAR